MSSPPAGAGDLPRRDGLTVSESLAERPMDGGGIAALERLSAPPSPEGWRAHVWRPTLSSGERPREASRALAHPPELEPAAGLPPGLPPVAFEHDGRTTRAQVRFPPGTSFYGAGLVPGGLLRNGRAVVFWNTDAWRYGESSPALYQSHPYALAVRADGSAAGVLADTVHRGKLWAAADGIELAFEDGAFDLVLIEGADPAAVTRGLSAMAGRMALPPLWALGYHQSRWSYASVAEALSIARELRARSVPCDALWLDIDYMDRYRSFTWDPGRFPDPRGLIDELRALGLRTVTILDPGLAADPANAPYASALDGGHLVLDARGELARGRVWPGVCAFPDFTREATREWWAGEVERFLGAGMDGLWNDMNEPSVFHAPTGTLPEDCVHRGLGGGSHRRFHNLYGQLMAQATHEGFRRARPEQRPFVLTRSSHLSGARFAATWTGDNQASWRDLAWSIPMVLSLGLCGQPFSGPDLGGFDGDPTPELFARWFELGAYLPFCRGHAERSSCRKEPWSFGPEVEAAVRAALERRMRLLPHLYTLFEEAARTGLPVARPLFFADPTDPMLRAAGDAFLLGTDLLVAPVVEPGADRRSLSLPRTAGGGWYAFPGGGELLPPGELEVAAPLGTTPVFARAGAAVVEGPLFQHTSSPRGGEWTLHVFLDTSRAAEGRLYEDAGDGYDHLGSSFRETRFSARWRDGELALEAAAEGGFEPEPRRWRALVHGAGTPGGVAVRELDEGSMR